jgi:hypothetical protein
MTEGSEQVIQIESDQQLETTAVAGAVAVQRLIADRKRLRDQLAASLTAQEELRRRLGMLHQRYVELARTVVSNLHQFDNTLREAIGQKPEVTNDAEPKRQFDSDGLPLSPPPLNSNHGGNGTLVGKILGRVEA